jgi:CRISPR/Cas system Type II protein with McrA/HNH and RuvC-like nuclease domain
MRDWRRRGAPGIAPTTPPARGPPQFAQHATIAPSRLSRHSRLRITRRSSRLSRLHHNRACVLAETSNFARAKQASQRAAHRTQFAHFAHSRLLL